MEPTIDVKKEIWSRQKGMCGLSGKKYEEFSEDADVVYKQVAPIEGEDNSPYNFVMIGKIFDQDFVFADAERLGLELKRYLFPYGAFPDYEEEKTAGDVKDDVERLTKIANESDDARPAENRLRETAQTIRNLNLGKERYEEISAQIDSAMQAVRERREEISKRIREEMKQNFEKFKPKLDEAIEKSGSLENFREAREILVNIQNEFKNEKLAAENKEEITSALNKAFDDLNRRQAEERESFEMECIDNYHRLKGLIDETLDKINKMKNLREARKLLISVQNEFKGLKLKKDKREEQYARIRAAFDELNKKQDAEREEYLKECDENYDNLKILVDKAVAFSQTAEVFKEAREKLIASQGEIKGKKLKRTQRDELYAIIRAAFEALNDRQDSEREQFDKECSDNYKMLKANVDGAIEFAKNSENFKQARETLIAAQSSIKGMKLKREQRDELYGVIRKTFEEVNDRQDAERETFEKECLENYSNLRAKVEESFLKVANSDDFREIREYLISVQNEIKILKLKRDKRNELFGEIRKAFAEFDRKRDDAQKKVFEEKKRKLESLQSNIEEKIARLEESVVRDEEALDKPDADAAEIRKRIIDKQKNIDENKLRLLDVRKELEDLENPQAPIQDVDNFSEPNESEEPDEKPAPAPAAENVPEEKPEIRTEPETETVPEPIEEQAPAEESKDESQADASEEKSEKSGED